MDPFTIVIAVLLVICLLSWLPRGQGRMFALPNIEYALTVLFLILACLWLYHHA